MINTASCHVYVIPTYTVKLFGTLNVLETCIYSRTHSMDELNIDSIDHNAAHILTSAILSTPFIYGYMSCGINCVMSKFLLV